MDNNKLGLKIVRINNGYTDLLEINGDQIWTQNVWDIRKNLENIDNLNGSSAVLMLISIDTGHMLTIASLIEGRITDCISAWIHIPAAISVSGEELVELVESVKKEILANTRNDEKLKQLFSKEYERAPANVINSNEVKQILSATKMAGASNREKCAFRYYGQGCKYTLEELLKDMYQSYYKNYKSIFLLDNSTNLKCLSGENLSDQKVNSMVVIKPPCKVDSFVPYIGGQPFVEQMYVVKGETINIEWKRDNYQSIKTECKCNAQSEIEYQYPKPEQYQKVIPYNIIKVLDEEEKDMQDYHLCINGQLIKKGESFIISENKLTQTKVKISANDYNDYEGCIDLTNKRTINLTKKIYTYEFLLPTKEHGNCTIEIKSKRIAKSPIDGYQSKETISDSQKNELHYQPFTKKYLVLCLIIVVISFCGGYYLYYLSDSITPKTYNKEINKLQRENQQLKKLQQDNQQLEEKIGEMENLIRKQNEEDSASLNEAINYLDNNEKWNRTEMEKYEETKGLWDDLNARRFDDILNYREKLSGSIKFNEVAECVEKYIENNKDKKVLRYHIFYDNDSVITIDDYISNLNDASVKNKSTKNNVSKKESQGNWK